MKIDIKLTTPLPDMVEVGNVYRCRGGRASGRGHMWVVLAVDKQRRSATLLMVDCEGEIVGTNTRALHYLKDQLPIAFVDGISDLVFTMRSL